MPFINPNHRGLAYGDGYLRGDGQFGQVVKIAGDDLKVSTNGKLTAGVQAGEEVIARAISASGGTIKFRLLI